MFRSRFFWITLLALALVVSLFVARHEYTRPDARLRRGQDAVRQRHWHRAEREVAALRAAGYDDHAHLLGGEVLLREEAYADALAEFNAIRDEGALRLEAAALSAECLVHLGNLREAERALRFVVAEQPQHVEAHRRLAVIYYDQGAMPLAIEHLEKVGQLDPADGRPFRLMGLIYKDYPSANEQAVACYEAALTRTLTPQVAREVRVELAECLVKQSQYQKALGVLDQLVDSPPSAQALRAESLWAVGRAEEARKVLAAARTDSPNDLGLLRLEAHFSLLANKPKEAAALLERVVEADPHDFTSRSRLAHAYESLNRPTDAASQRHLAEQTRVLLRELTDLSQAAQDRPWDPAVRRRLAEVCRKLDKKDLAEMWLRAAAACPPAARPAQALP
jgi:tetratricopeptide (TPR) repeat protein